MWAIHVVHEMYFNVFGYACVLEQKIKNNIFLDMFGVALAILPWVEPY